MSRVASFPLDPAARRQQPLRSPKVVSIPVHFVGSEAASSAPPVPRPMAAIRIQKVWRGFVVRKNVKKILGIKREADAIEKRISDKDSADLIRGHAKERLKVNEMLMALLFRLDSIRGVDFGVRDCRKRVIKKVIMLQERVDSIASRDAEDVAEESEDSAGQIEPENQTAAERSAAEESRNSEDQVEEENAENQKQIECSTGEEEAADAGESVQDPCSEVEQGYLPVKGEAEEDAMDCEAAVGNVAGSQNNTGLMEKMIEKSEILIALVNDLCEKNRMQTQMIDSLSSRVDSLEKLFRSKCKRRKQQQLPKC